MTRDQSMSSLTTMQHAFSRALMIRASRGDRAEPIALPVGRVNPDELRHVLVAIKCRYASKGVKNG